MFASLFTSTVELIIVISISVILTWRLAEIHFGGWLNYCAYMHAVVAKNQHVLKASIAAVIVISLTLLFMGYWLAFVLFVVSCGLDIWAYLASKQIFE